jgi:predicted PurR-regulated permease PerM
VKRPDPAVLRLLVFAGGLVATVAILLIFRGIFLPLLLGLGIAYVLNPAVTSLERRGLPRRWGALIIALVVLLGLLGLLFYVVPEISAQVRRLAERFPEYEQRLEAQLAPWLDRLQARYPQIFADFQQRLTVAIRENLPRLASEVGAWLARIFGSLLSFFLFLLTLIFVPVFAFYILVDFPQLKAGARSLIPVPYRPVVLSRLKEVDQVVGAFLRGQLTIALILAAINSTGLMLLQVPLGLAIGLVAGLANMIPYMSLVVGLLPALLLCWAEHQSWARLLGVIAVFSGAQLLEGTYLSPRILGRSVNLHPVWVLLAIIVGGSLFGFVGMLIAVPAAAAIQVFVRHWLAAYRSSPLYLAEPREGGPPPPAGRPGGPGIC